MRIIDQRPFIVIGDMALAPAIFADSKEMYYVDFGVRMKIWDTEQC